MCGWPASIRRNRASRSPCMPNRKLGRRRAKAWTVSISRSKTSSVPGRRQTATPGSPTAAKPRVSVPGNRVEISRSPTRERTMDAGAVLRIGVISDTHGLLRPQLEQRLAGVAHIIHAGDIGRPEVIAGLRRIAPVSAIRGNVDTGDWAEHYPDTHTV